MFGNEKSDSGKRKDRENHHIDFPQLIMRILSLIMIRACAHLGYCQRMPTPSSTQQVASERKANK
jgi:hypothetical protein